MLKPVSPLALFLEMLAICLLAPSFLAGRSKVDVIHLKNGDTITGEITRLQRGILSVSTDFMGTVGVEWRGVRGITSSQAFEVDTGAGARLRGVFPESAQDGVIRIGWSSGDAETVERIEIVRIRPLEKDKFWDRFESRVDLGFDVTRANRSATLHLASVSSYTTEKATTEINYSSFLTRQQALDTLTRNDLKVSHERRFKDRWFGVGLYQYQQNEELGLAFRTLGGGGVGRYVRQSANLILRTAAGMAVVRERFHDEPQGMEDNSALAKTNVEGFAAVTLDYFRFEGNERDISTSVVVWPNFSDVGRVRIDISSGIRYEIFKDFSWGLNFWNNFDSRPATTTGEKNDFGISTTVGYKF